jgi:hypothetical protein
MKENCFGISSGTIMHFTVLLGFLTSALAGKFRIIF